MASIQDSKFPSWGFQSSYYASTKDQSFGAPFFDDLFYSDMFSSALSTDVSSDDMASDGFSSDSKSIEMSNDELSLDGFSDGLPSEDYSACNFLDPGIPGGDSHFLLDETECQQSIGDSKKDSKIQLDDVMQIPLSFSHCKMDQMYCSEVHVDTYNDYNDMDSLHNRQISDPFDCFWPFSEVLDVKPIFRQVDSPEVQLYDGICSTPESEDTTFLNREIALLSSPNGEQVLDPSSIGGLVEIMDNYQSTVVSFSFADPEVTKIDHCYLKTPLSQSCSGSDSKKSLKIRMPDFQVSEKRTPSPPQTQVPIKRRVGRPRKVVTFCNEQPVQALPSQRGRKPSKSAKRPVAVKVAPPAKRLRVQNMQSSKTWRKSSALLPSDRREQHNKAERLRRDHLKRNLQRVQDLIPEIILQNAQIVTATVKQECKEDVENNVIDEVFRRLEESLRNLTASKRIVKQKKGAHYSKMVVLLSTAHHVRSLKQQQELKSRAIKDLEFQIKKARDSLISARRKRRKSSSKH